jgi:hypothetical protein
MFCVGDNHHSPGDGLEPQPLQADCAAKRENRDGATNATKHAHEISDALFIRQSKQAKRIA